LVLFFGAMVVVVGEKAKKKSLCGEFGHKGEEFVEFKEKANRKKNLRRRKNLRVNGVHVEFGTARKGMENLEEFKRNLGRLMKELK